MKGVHSRVAGVEQFSGLSNLIWKTEALVTMLHDRSHNMVYQQWRTYQDLDIITIIGLAPAELVPNSNIGQGFPVVPKQIL